jgi:hypothetical protein
VSFLIKRSSSFASSYFRSTRFLLFVFGLFFVAQKRNKHKVGNDDVYGFGVELQDLLDTKEFAGPKGQLLETTVSRFLLYRAIFAGKLDLLRAGGLSSSYDLLFCC